MVLEPSKNKIAEIIKITKVMRDNHKNMKSIDQIFKDQFDNTEIPFDPAAWEMLAQKNKKDDKLLFGFNARKISGVIVLVILLAIPFIYWQLKDENSSEQAKYGTNSRFITTEEPQLLQSKDETNSIENSINNNKKAIPTNQTENPQFSQELEETQKFKASINIENPQLSQTNTNQSQKAQTTAKSKDQNQNNSEASHLKPRDSYGSSSRDEISNANLDSDFEIKFENTPALGNVTTKNDQEINLESSNFENETTEFNIPIYNVISPKVGIELETLNVRTSLYIYKLKTLDALQLVSDTTGISIDPKIFTTPLSNPHNRIYAEVQFNLYAGDFQDGSINVRPFPISIGYKWFDSKSMYSNLFLRYDYTQTDREFSTLDINFERSFSLESAFSEHAISANVSVGLRLGKFVFIEGHGGLGLSSLSKDITLRAGDFDNPEIALKDSPKFAPFGRVSYGFTLGVNLWKEDVQLFVSAFNNVALTSTLTEDEIDYPTIPEYECESCYNFFDFRYNKPIDIFKITFGIRKTIF